MIGTILLAATLIENAIAITNAAVAIDAAIVAKGGTTEGGLNNAAAAIAALPSGGEFVWSVTNGVPIYDSSFDVYMADHERAFQNDVYLLDVTNYNFIGIYKASTGAGTGFSYLFQNSHITNCVFHQLLSTAFDMFWNSQLETFYAPNLKQIFAYTFEGCKKLKTIDTPNVVDVANNAFYGTVVSEYGGCNIYFTNKVYSAVAPWNTIPWGGSQNIWFHFSNGVVKYVDGAWTLTTE